MISKLIGDIDIDVANVDHARKALDNIVRASIIENGDITPHGVGIYLRNMPVDRLTGLAAIPYDRAPSYGFTKFDILHLRFLETFTHKRQIRALLKRSPDWSMLCDDTVIPKLFHLARHGNILKAIQPTSVEEVADILALIRPNKTHLINKYIKNKAAVRCELYKKVNESDLRKSHAIPYALIISLQLHLIKAGII